MLLESGAVTGLSVPLGHGSKQFLSLSDCRGLGLATSAADGLVLFSEVSCGTGRDSLEISPRTPLLCPCFNLSLVWVFVVLLSVGGQLAPEDAKRVAEGVGNPSALAAEQDGMFSITKPGRFCAGFAPELCLYTERMGTGM